MDKKLSVEILAPTVEEAVSEGLMQLGISENEAEVEVLDAGSRGFLGLGSRDVRVRISVKATPVVAEPKKMEAKTESRVAQPVEAPSQPDLKKPAVEEDEDDRHVLELAESTVIELLSRMRVEARVKSWFSEPDDLGSRALHLDIQGDDLGILIGRRAETLNALQYIVSLIVSKQEERWVQLVIDVEGYRMRREKQIRQLARKMAEQAVRTGRRQVLEPMPASERRIIHLELRDNDTVTTESFGEDPARKVTIIPK